MMRPMRGLALCLGLLPVVGFAVAAHADDAGTDAGTDAAAPTPPPACPTAAADNAIYVAGGDIPLLVALAKQLALDSSTPPVLVQMPQRSCTAVDYLNRRQKFTAAQLTDKPQYFDKDGKAVLCTLDPAGVEPDVAFSDSFASTCGLSVNTDVGDFFGPISPQVFVTPAASTQMAISAEAAYIAFGVNNGQSKPWIDPSAFYVRDATSGTQQVISSMIGVPADSWWGSKAQGSSKIIPAMIKVPAADADKSIGTLPSENAQPAATRAKLRILAFQAKGQIAAFWPDSTVDSNDKKSVRDGHYALWGPLHLFAHVDSAGKANINAAPIVDRFASTALPPQVLDAVTDNFLVPRCAMKVRRTTEGGPLSAYSPETSCSCYFDFRTTGKTSCTPCTATTGTTDPSCPSEAPKCNYGYCEVK